MKQVASEADLLLVVGSENSSNSNRLVEVARNLGTNVASNRQLQEHQARVAGRCEDNLP